MLDRCSKRAPCGDTQESSTGARKRKIVNWPASKTISSPDSLSNLHLNRTSGVSFLFVVPLFSIALQRDNREQKEGVNHARCELAALFADALPLLALA